MFDYFVSFIQTVIQLQNIILWVTVRNVWYHTTPNAIDEVSHKSVPLFMVLERN